MAEKDILWQAGKVNNELKLVINRTKAEVRCRDMARKDPLLDCDIVLTLSFNTCFVHHPPQPPPDMDFVTLYTAPVMIPTAIRRLHHLNVNICRSGTLSEMIDAVVLLVSDC